MVFGNGRLTFNWKICQLKYDRASPVQILNIYFIFLGGLALWVFKPDYSSSSSASFELTFIGSPQNNLTNPTLQFL